MLKHQERNVLGKLSISFAGALILGSSLVTPMTEAAEVPVPGTQDGEITHYIINDNVPYFTNDELLEVDPGYTLSDLDELGRVQVANATLSQDIMPDEKRGSISHVRPTGWNQNASQSDEVGQIVPGGWLYNRSHMIGHQLSGLNDEKENLITGTKFFNNYAMLPIENFVANYIEEEDESVRFRVTPHFEGDNLLASGMFMEGLTLHDIGDEDPDIMFNIYVPNIQPGVTLNYADGSNSVGETNEVVIPTHPHAKNFEAVTPPEEEDNETVPPVEEEDPEVPVGEEENPDTPVENDPEVPVEDDNDETIPPVEEEDPDAPVENEENPDAPVENDGNEATDNESIEEDVTTDNESIEEDVTTDDESIEEDVTPDEESVEEDVTSDEESVEEDVASDEESVEEDVATVEEDVATDDESIEEDVTTDNESVEEDVATEDESIEEDVATEDVTTDDEATLPVEEDNVEATLPVEDDNVEATLPVEEDNVEATLPVEDDNVEATLPAEEDNIETTLPIEETVTSDDQHVVSDTQSTDDTASEIDTDLSTIHDGSSIQKPVIDEDADELPETGSSAPEIGLIASAMALIIGASLALFKRRETNNN